jgi:Sporulation and spore germination.
VKKVSLMVLLALALLLCGCKANIRNPLEAAGSTLVPGTDSEVHSPVARQDAGDTYQAVLYFRFMQENLLAQESRRLNISMDNSVEKALVAALMQGPSATSPELRRLFSGQVEVLSAVSQGSTVFITLSESVLSEPQADRFLQMQSLAATLCENCGYENVQVLVDKRSGPTTSLRLSNSFFSPDMDGAAPPLTRDENYLLGPYRTAQTILNAWLKKDFERLYTFMATQNMATSAARPPLNTALIEMDSGFSLISFGLENGTVFPDGGKAVLGVDMTLLQGTSDKRSIVRYPLTLVRENGIWKMRYEELMALIRRDRP